MPAAANAAAIDVDDMPAAANAAAVDVDDMPAAANAAAFDNMPAADAVAAILAG